MFVSIIDLLYVGWNREYVITSLLSVILASNFKILQKHGKAVVDRQ